MSLNASMMADGKEGEVMIMQGMSMCGLGAVRAPQRIRRTGTPKPV